MGQLIKKLHGLTDDQSKLNVELNGPIYGNENIIHFHYENVRFEMSLSDYLMVLSGINLANKSLKELKK